MKKILLTLSIVSLFTISTIMILNAYDVIGKEKKVGNKIKLIGDIDLETIIQSIKNDKDNNITYEDRVIIYDDISSNTITTDNTAIVDNTNNLFTNIITTDEYTNNTEIDINNKVIAEITSYITIVIDDCGNSLKRYKEYIDLASKYDITFAIMPDAPHATKFDELCFENNINTIIHMPMQNKDARNFGEKTVIKTYMDYEQISNLLDYAFNLVPHATGINNHTGSLATSDSNTVLSISKFLKSREKYFFDSLTAGSSVVGSVAKIENIATAKRDIFLDNQDNYEAVLSQWRALIRMAKKNGSAIAIGHYWSDNTFNVLSNELPNIHKEGIITRNIKEALN